MLCVVINGPSLEEAQQQLNSLPACVELVELRLDTFSERPLEKLQALCAHFPIPMIFTLRSASQGGAYQQSEEQRLAEILRLCSLKPAYLDLESHLPLDFIKLINATFPSIKIILSSHNFNDTPQNAELDLLYQSMQLLPAFFYKIAVMAHNTLDALRFLCWMKYQDNKLIGISMGAFGQISRILAPVVGSPITYACLHDDQPAAPGQISAQTLSERYAHSKLSEQTALYGLIGDPVDKSISDRSHNALLQALNLDAVYVKMLVKAHELPLFLQMAKELPFSGLSVTMPLKEHVMPCLDSIDSRAREIGAVNTLVLRKGTWQGFNTDGVGALNAIEKAITVSGKKVVILGAGGAARAISYEAKRRGAHLTIVNRDICKAKLLAENFQASAKSLEHVHLQPQEPYDILINTTPLPMPIPISAIQSQTTVMDIKTLPFASPFLACALQKDCCIIPGYHMFVEQALGQYKLWFQKEHHLFQNNLLFEIVSLLKANGQIGLPTIPAKH